MMFEHVAITEHDDDDPERRTWEVTQTGSPRILFSCKTAIQALAAVKARDLADTLSNHRNIVTVITWNPKTSVGLAVVKAITETR